MPAALKDWHPGEQVIQRKLGYHEAIKHRWSVIESQMPEQHRIFHASSLPFIPITTIDSHGRPWAAIVAGAKGEVGFVKSPDRRTLNIHTRLWAGDPLLNTLEAAGAAELNEERCLTAGIGIEFPTRRRNKFAGWIKGVKQLTELDYELDLEVTQALGNCPKYINVRQLIPYPDTHATVEHQTLQMGPSARLPDEAIQLVKEADTVFIATIYRAEDATSHIYPSHTGMNARGGLPGFMRVLPSDKRTIILPEYSGNRFVSSLGNIETSHTAGLTIVSFVTGDILYLTGTANVLVGPPAQALMLRQGCVVEFETTGYTLVRNALPVRQAPDTDVDRSPYSPKIRYLVGEPEASAAGMSSLPEFSARLIGAKQYAHDIATFRFQMLPKDVGQNNPIKHLQIRPGQAIALDFMEWTGPPTYQHMAKSAPSSVNDDRIRTWTVSSAQEGVGDTSCFEITMREMENGAITGALFDLIRAQAPRDSEDNRSVAFESANVRADVVGVMGDFSLEDGIDINLLLIAGGIGVTPFLAMLSALIQRAQKQHVSADVVLTLSARDAGVLLRLVQTSLGHARLPTGVKVHVDLFTRQKRDSFRIVMTELMTKGVRVLIHERRIQKGYWADVVADRQVFVCGPVGFADAVVEGIRDAGVDNRRIHREGFY